MGLLTQLILILVAITVTYSYRRVRKIHSVNVVELDMEITLPKPNKFIEPQTVYDDYYWDPSQPINSDYDFFNMKYEPLMQRVPKPIVTFSKHFIQKNEDEKYHNKTELANQTTTEPEMERTKKLTKVKKVEKKETVKEIKETVKERKEPEEEKQQTVVTKKAIVKKINYDELIKKLHLPNFTFKENFMPKYFNHETTTQHAKRVKRTADELQPMEVNLEPARKRSPKVLESRRFNFKRPAHLHFHPQAFNIFKKPATMSSDLVDDDKTLKINNIRIPFRRNFKLNSGSVTHMPFTSSQPEVKIINDLVIPRNEKGIFYLPIIDDVERSRVSDWSQLSGLLQNM